MNKSLDHLPSLKRAELLRVVDVLKASFAEAMSTKRADRLKNGRILKIILYGSYARGDWVHDPVGRYFSDFDILIVVDHEDLTDSEVWDAALWRTTPGVSRLRTPVSFIVHSLDDVNRQLERGRSFFADILREGIVLEDTPGAKFVMPEELSPKVALAEVEEHFEEWFDSSEGFRDTAAYNVEKGRLKLAAFHLHQATEHLYHCVLLVLTLYSPKSHNLVFLRRRCEPLDGRLQDAFPHDTKFERRCFELLRAAYVKARYSKHYKITDEELFWLTERVNVLSGQVKTICEERVVALRARVEAA
ncbi:MULTISPECIES: HEPN domain-containing protein [unclassified Brevundimonas]|uniref:HEPN domain-containing protein n=1 Tax=unclassified Brevundimonas TaxID=2622653 RepID=UPI000CFCC857|nr:MULTISPECIES: HEPN domain-containing protein [unclassified Brevundimonas]PRA27176.1 nucleotidyltransferase [Brevundimonas sp. MYb27]PQZ77363.1 nucleotidyltransferase [Brevundimonas sp. MYb31]PRB17593.1 nucleotidyltransferase [Brevundimonas sp. MYb52]PRB37965.1 nucleotidyltransferase [Brevundimonas sp. MYb46]PRB46314.1 nucleotidyltransferase [Brevundimonas sp. MYb33]